MISTKIKNFIKSHSTLLSFVGKFLPILIRIKVIRKRLYNLIGSKTDNQKLMINIGGGPYFRRHWKVLDFQSKWYSYPKGCIDYEFDLTSSKSFPLSNNSVFFFFSSHTLEHIPQENCQHIFDEIFRCLKPGGAVRITVPDFDLAYEAFRKNDIDFFVKYDGKCIEKKFLSFFATYLIDNVSIEELRKKFTSMKKKNFADYYTRQIPRDSHKLFIGNHINWWNYEKLRRMLKRAGFKKIYRSVKQGSRFIEMHGFGRNSGFDSTHPEISLFVEAVK
jgi:ubiquinone/menaquinone biosynthesis C-methylase UbiE